MKILVVRLSSLGDILHLFPAISDLRRRLPETEIHWLVEPAFAEMVSWHFAIDKVITVPLRAHKKAWWKLPRLLSGLKKQLKAEKYDFVLDAQGLLKSAMLARLAVSIFTVLIKIALVNRWRQGFIRKQPALKRGCMSSKKTGNWSCSYSVRISRNLLIMG